MVQGPEIGLTGVVTAAVRVEDTAMALGSGDVEVLGTPRVLALMEAACLAALAGRLPEDRTSVGSRVHLEHAYPAAVGVPVVATATLVSVQGRALRFDVAVLDADERVLAHGSLARVVVDRARFGTRGAGA
ncbi:MAG: thioesterase family protein [Actinomycetes bacterium]